MSRGLLPLDDLVVLLKQLHDQLGCPGDTWQHRIRTLQAMEAWALTQLHVRAGDWVELVGVPLAGNWANYTGQLADGRVAKVELVHFNSYRTGQPWQAVCFLDGYEFHIGIEYLKSRTDHE